MKMFSGILVSALLLFSEVTTPAQTWADVQAAGSRYLWAEGWGDSVEEADREALSALAGKISLTIVSTFRSVEGKTTQGRETVGYADVQSSLSTFSSATLAGTGFEVLDKGRECHVVRWISRDEVERMRERRAAQVKEYLSQATRCENEGKISGAIKHYYWAYALVRAYPELVSLTLNDGRLLSEWLPSRINELLQGMRVNTMSQSGGQVVLAFSCNGRRVVGIEFRYFDGGRWSDVITAYEGRVTVRLHYNTPPEYLHILYEYSFRYEAAPGSELALALEYISGEPLRRAHCAVPFNNW